VKRADLTPGEQYALRASKYDTPKPVTVLSVTARRRYGFYSRTVESVEIVVAGKTWSIPGMFDPVDGPLVLVSQKHGYAVVALKSLYPLSAIDEYKAEQQARMERKIQEQAAQDRRQREAADIVLTLRTLGIEARTVAPFQTVVMSVEAARKVADRLALLDDIAPGAGRE
jgi:hypothetical protein